MRYFTIIIALIMMSSFAYAAKNKIGQRYYLKNCSSCHGKGNRGGALAMGNEWKDYFKNDAKKLISFHNENKEVVTYLKSKSFIKYQHRIQNFLLEFASDSANIPSCNN